MLVPSLRYLKAVADHGSFTRAAAALHVSQPALSQQIRELEERMGVQLLDRSGRTVRPTDMGEAYLRHVRRALDELEVGGRAIRDVKDLSSGALRLGFTPSFAIYLLGPLIRRYRDRFPGIVLGVAMIQIYLSVPVAIYGTLWAFIFAFTVRYLPFGMRYAASGDRKSVV